MTYATWSQRPSSALIGEVPTCIDLFCGAGGLSLGFAQAGGLPVAAVDHDTESMATYSANFPMCTEVLAGDIETWTAPSSVRGVDVVIGGPPCQGFSLARGTRFLDDPRNHLYKEFVRLVKQLQPSWIVMENVQGITNIGDGAILRQIYEDFQAAGYALDHRVVNMAEYGVPQTRKRAIFVGSRRGTPFTWPTVTHRVRGDQTTLLPESPFVSIADAIDDLPWDLGEYFAHRANSKMRGPRNRRTYEDPAFTLRVRGDEFALCEVPATGAFPPGPCPERELVYRTASTWFQRAMREVPPDWARVQKRRKITSEPKGKLVGTRRLHPRELARLQSFPDWFQFSGGSYSQGRQIGNAVPPLFARQLFASILTAL